jgi:hypothetical protein
MAPAHYDKLYLHRLRIKGTHTSAEALCCITILSRVAAATQQFIAYPCLALPCLATDTDADTRPARGPCRAHGVCHMR